MKTIELTVDAQGATTLTTRGFAGPSCRAASRPYEEALGARTADRPTPEIHLTAPEARLDLRQGQ